MFVISLKPAAVCVKYHAIMKRHLIYLITVFAAYGVVFGSESIMQIIARPHQKNAVFCILAVRADDGKALYSRNAQNPMIPASNMKLVSSAAALYYLGADYVYQTRAALQDGNLVVIGAGDPVLGDAAVDACSGRKDGWAFDAIVCALQDKGVTQVGDVILDSFFFDQNRVHLSWPADQLNQWYACETSGINYNRNCVRIVASRNGAATLEMEPDNDYIELVSQLRAVTRGASAVGAYRTNTPNRLTVRGNINKETGFDVAIERPSGLFGNLLVRRLRAAGIAVNGQIVERYVPQRESLAAIATLTNTLWDVLDRCNKDSFGLAAESLIKTISAENTQGRINGEWPHGLTLVGRYLNTLGIDDAQFVLDDGSGLSRKNRLSCSVLTAILRDAYQKPYGQRFVETLAEAGVDGTIGKYFHEAPYRGNICGKTGYIAGVRTFSGVCKTPRGDIIFSIMTEGGNSMTRQCINDITKRIFDGTF